MIGVGCRRPRQVSSRGQGLRQAFARSDLEGPADGPLTFPAHVAVQAASCTVMPSGVPVDVNLRAPLSTLLCGGRRAARMGPKVDWSVEGQRESCVSRRQQERQRSLFGRV